MQLSTHWPNALQTSLPEQLPQSMVPPQPSDPCPHSLSARSHVCGTQAPSQPQELMLHVWLVSAQSSSQIPPQPSSPQQSPTQFGTQTDWHVPPTQLMPSGQSPSHPDLGTGSGPQLEANTRKPTIGTHQSTLAIPSWQRSLGPMAASFFAKE